MPLAARRIEGVKLGSELQQISSNWRRELDEGGTQGTGLHDASRVRPGNDFPVIVPDA
jgi:hypothetical protein